MVEEHLERTLVLVKPDGVKRGLTGEIIQRFEERGLKLIGVNMRWIDEDTAKQHYSEEIAERHGETVRNNLITFITGGPVVALAFEGAHAAEIGRKLVGDTEPRSAQPGTIRGDYAHQSIAIADAADVAVANLVHASEDAEDAEKELGLWFSEEDLYEYSRADELHHFGEEQY